MINEHAQQYDQEAEFDSNVFEQLAFELLNIENCLTYLVDLASNHKQARFSRIIDQKALRLNLETIIQDDLEDKSSPESGANKRKKFSN